MSKCSGGVLSGSIKFTAEKDSGLLLLLPLPLPTLMRMRTYLEDHSLLCGIPTGARIDRDTVDDDRPEGVTGAQEAAKRVKLLLERERERRPVRMRLRNEKVRRMKLKKRLKGRRGGRRRESGNESNH